MIKLKKILVPVDFSQQSMKAIDYGAALALKFQARLVLAHIVPSLSAFNYAFPSDTYDLEKQAFADAKVRIPQLVPAEYKDVDLQTIVKGGDVREELLGVVTGEGIDLMVMGTHGRGAMSRMLLGSTTENILRRVPSPILTVSHLNVEHDMHNRRRVPIERIVYATDLSDNMRVGLRYSAELARAFQAELTVLNVMENLDFVGHTSVPARQMVRDNAKSRIDWAMNEEGLTNIPMKVEIIEDLEGGAHGAIVRFAKNEESDLIVLNLHSKTFLERAMLGATAERVIRIAEVPVLSLPVLSADRFLIDASSALGR